MANILVMINSHVKDLEKLLPIWHLSAKNKFGSLPEDTVKTKIVKTVKQKLITSQFESFVLPLLQMFMEVPISRALYY